MIYEQNITEGNTLIKHSECISIIKICSLLSYLF